MRVDLSQFDDVYDELDPPNSSEVAREIPDGTYQVRVDGVELKLSKLRDDGGGNPMLQWKLVVLSPGDWQDEILWKRSMIVTEDNVRFLKGDLEICGLHLGRFSELGQRLQELLDIMLEVKKVTKGHFTNIYFQSRLDLSKPAPASPGKAAGKAAQGKGAPKKKSDLPF